MTKTHAPEQAADGGADAPATRYEPGRVEARWLAAWEENGVFDADVEEGRESYTIVLPPPNVTGALHMGHALNGSIQDCLIRWKRMQGYVALWQPGVDHAGIATQAVVEKQLRAAGEPTRQELGRDRFLERVWAWKEQSGSQIISQYRRLGASMDYRRERFTMDEGYERAVLEAFVRLFDAGHVYRAERLINWDAGTMSAISDLEVVQEDHQDELVQVAYPVVDEPGRELVVATVRPETIVADVAVAVHPEDERHRDLVGRMVRVPFVDREVPVIADDYVDPEFGTGALKVTPGHDINDFEIGERHGLEVMSAIEPDRTMSALAGEFAGMHADEARRKMADRLEELGLLRGREEYHHSVPHSERSGERIEPLVSMQWFADMRELAEPATAAVREGRVTFHPKSSEAIFSSWMDDLKPWCLSRQLWWGHQLPVWYCCADESHVHVSVEGPEDAPCPECGGSQWRRDPDVLDTWFSSGLWDHATLGWPDETPDLDFFHPTAVLCTAREIINLWVARMMMFSLAHLDEVPFHDVYIHSVVQAPDGRRMSKSLGTGIDPIEAIDEHGADAVRYGLLHMSSTQDVRYNVGKIREGRDLATKVFNAVRLVRMLGDESVLEPALVEEGGFEPAAAERLEDRWVLMRLDRVQRSIEQAFERYEFAQAVKELYAFAWGELCDWYLESVKGRLRSEDAAERAVATRTLAFALDRVLRLAHPVMPHVTEELAATLLGEPAAAGEPGRAMLAVSEWHAATLDDETREAWAGDVERYGRLQGLATRLRSLRQAADIKPSATVAARLEGIDGEALAEEARLLAELARVDVTAHEGEGVAIPAAGGAIVLGGLDESALRDRLASDLEAARGEVARVEKKLSNERFVANAPAEVVEADRAKQASWRAEAEALAAVLEQLG